ncbi:MAG: YdcF family protein [Rhodospirillales bacterium]
MVLLLGLTLTATRFRRAGRWLVGLAVMAALVVTFVPVGASMMKTLENRFPVPSSLPQNIDGIVVLGGVIDPVMSAVRKDAVINGAVERITVSAALARAHPGARIIFTGGSGSITEQGFKEADYVSSLYASLGIPQERLTLEREARNTWENAKYSAELVSPGLDETWILVTSAFHMPRAVGAFRRVGWKMIPYPVDFVTTKTISFPSPVNFAQGLGDLSNAGHEWLGLISYWLTGKNSSAFPKPHGPEVQ